MEGEFVQEIEWFDVDHVSDSPTGLTLEDQNKAARTVFVGSFLEKQRDERCKKLDEWFNV